MENADDVVISPDRSGTEVERIAGGIVLKKINIELLKKKNRLK